MIQGVVWAVSMILMGSLAAVFLWVASGATSAIEDYGPAIATAYHFRPWLFLIALLVLFGVNYKALGELPYIRHAAAGAGAIQRVTAVGEQWDWMLKPDKVVAGQPVEFHVTSKDVNHGFAIYDPDLRIVAQTQAMPGYENVLRYTFTEPGTYQILCLEYCGVAHHDMKTDFTVVAH